MSGNREKYKLMEQVFIRSLRQKLPPIFEEMWRQVRVKYPTERAEELTGPLYEGLVELVNKGLHWERFPDPRMARAIIPKCAKRVFNELLDAKIDEEQRNPQ